MQDRAKSGQCVVRGQPNDAALPLPLLSLSLSSLHWTDSRITVVLFCFHTSISMSIYVECVSVCVFVKTSKGRWRRTTRRRMPRELLYTWSIQLDGRREDRSVQGAWVQNDEAIIMNRGWPRTALTHTACLLLLDGPANSQSRNRVRETERQE